MRRYPRQARASSSVSHRGVVMGYSIYDTSVSDDRQRVGYLTCHLLLD
jgi:hypothetical protein